uniref:Uncharacterized protein n=1 Tax=Glossina palpalis gambiensis TaxID=67801 RepID=A0A1B0C2S3_9MUSC
MNEKVRSVSGCASVAKGEQRQQQRRVNYQQHLRQQPTITDRVSHPPFSAFGYPVKHSPAVVKDSPVERQKQQQRRQFIGSIVIAAADSESDNIHQVNDHHHHHHHTCTNAQGQYLLLLTLTASAPGHGRYAQPGILLQHRSTANGTIIEFEEAITGLHSPPGANQIAKRYTSCPSDSHCFSLHPTTRRAIHRIFPTSSRDERWRQRLVSALRDPMEALNAHSDQQATLARALAALALTEAGTQQCRPEAVEDSDTSDHTAVHKRAQMVPMSHSNVIKSALRQWARAQKGQPVSQLLSTMPRSVQQTTIQLQEDMREEYRRRPHRLEEVFFVQRRRYRLILNHHREWN